MTINYANILLTHLLEEHQINADKFNRLFRALSDAPYIEKGSVRLTTKQPYNPLVMVAKYTGEMPIGKARLPKRKGADPGVKDAVTRIYQDISKRSGVRFTKVHPALDDDECIGYATMNSGYGISELPLILTKD